MGKKKKNGKGLGGFTLIELMIVIAIIAILAAVAIPNFMNARDRARLGGGSQGVSNLVKALEMFYNDYNAYPGENGAAAAGIAACNLDDKLTAASWDACLGSAAGALKISNVKQQMSVFAGDTLAVSDFSPDTAYAIEGKLRDRGGSYICASPNGIITMVNKSDGTFDRCDPPGVPPPVECAKVDVNC